MKEYIERTAVEKFIEDGLNNPDKNKAFGHDAIEIMAEVHYMQAADVVEVRHGHWIDLNAENSTGPLFKCSECSHLHNPNRNDLDLERVELNPLYCDACGASMDKEET